MKHRTIHVLMVTTLTAVALFALDCGFVAVADGWYDLTVVIDKDLGSKVESVSFCPVLNSESADAVVASFEDYLESMEHQDTVAPLVISVGYSFRVSGLGRKSNGSQEYSDVIVVLHLSDGTREPHRLPVPHRDVSRRLVVSDENLVNTTSRTTD